MNLDIDGKEAEKRIGKLIHYPDCWDTIAYPTLAIALWEMNDLNPGVNCSQCNKPMGINTDIQNKKNEVSKIE